MSWRGIVGKAFLPGQFIDYVGQTTFQNWRPRFVVLHNTSAPTLVQYQAYAGRGITDEQWLLNLQGYYRDQMKWSAGPHLFVTPDKVLAFTPLNVPGTHSPSWNGVSWGVEMIGEYETETFTDTMRVHVVNTLAVLHAKLGIDPQTLMYHREDPLTPHKTCPGKNVGPKSALITEVEQALANLGQGEHSATLTS